MALSANTHFGIELFKIIARDKGQENVFISPFSISTALAMTHLGAKGQTARGMEKCLQWPTDSADDIHRQNQSFLELLQTSHGNFNLSSANRIYIHKNFPVLQDFTKKTMSYYLADAVNADFTGNTETERANINRWVEEKTQNKIKSLIERGILNASTRMVLVNAIYFQGTWDIKFKASLTESRKFKSAPGKEINTPTMCADEEYAVTESQDLNCRALELPYKGKDLSMVILLPVEDFGLKDLIKNLTQEKLTSLFSSLNQCQTEDIRLTLPKFEVSSSHSLKDILSSMGMTDAFNESTADFSGMTGSKDLAVTEVIHKAFVKVDEEGTEAAAATAIAMCLMSLRLEPTTFIVDHPFLFIIRDKRGSSDGTVLFMGAISDPTVQLSIAF